MSQGHVGTSEYVTQMTQLEETPCFVTVGGLLGMPDLSSFTTAADTPVLESWLTVYAAGWRLIQ